MQNIGTVSSGTMRPKDLIPEFLDCLESQKDITPSDSQLCVKIRKCFEDEEDAEAYFDSEDAGWDLEQLFDALEAYAPPYFYFGAHEGNGSDYGFWLSNDSLEMAVHDDEILKVDDLANIPDDWTGEVLHVNDHGNCTLYHPKGWYGKIHNTREWVAIWAIV